MRLKIYGKLTVSIFLLCLLFLTNNLSVLDRDGLVSSDNGAAGISSVNTGSTPATVSNGFHPGPDDYLAPTNTIRELSISSLRQVRPLGTKTNFYILALIIAVQAACLIFCFRSLVRIHTVSLSGLITIFLHKKDGKT